MTSSRISIVFSDHRHLADQAAGVEMEGSRHVRLEKYEEGENR
jgi:hypothetical protein